MFLKRLPSWILLILLMILIIILLSAIIIYIESSTLPTPKVADGLTAIISAFIGVLITIAVTSVLLNKQTEMETDKEKDIIQFKQKQNAYLSFLKQFESIVVSLTERNIKGNDCKAYENITKVEKLLFEFSYLKLHIKENLFNEVLTHITQVFETYNKIKLRDLYQTEIAMSTKRSSPKLNTNLYELMIELSKHLFAISELLYLDLYGNNKTLVNTNEFDLQENTKKLLYGCGLRKNEAELIFAEDTTDTTKKQ